MSRPPVSCARCSGTIPCLARMTCPAVPRAGASTSVPISMSGNAVFRLAVVFGEGIENYMNDATVDVGAVPTGDPTHSLDGEALPMVGITGVRGPRSGATRCRPPSVTPCIDMDNSVGQSPQRLQERPVRIGQRDVHPVKNVMFGPEVIWIRRENNSDGFDVDDVRVPVLGQVQLRHNFRGQVT